MDGVYAPNPAPAKMGYTVACLVRLKSKEEAFPITNAAPIAYLIDAFVAGDVFPDFHVRTPFQKTPRGPGTPSPAAR
jgi:hypothetical protein